ncbi:MAG: DUF971 domain-containing protein [Archangium sp.]|nr:DUF971 domain-containing protein [Archangium sp.]
MSIWDQVKKPAKKAATASEIVLAKDQRSVALKWTDGAESTVSARRLRQFCPCAECVEEWSGKRTFEIDTIPADMKVLQVEAVGNYALSFTFGDAHRTGIFQWSYLRELAEAEVPRS